MDQLPPSAYNLTSDTWRPYQYDTIQRVCNAERDQTGVYLPFINEAPTGCHRIGQLILMADLSLKKVEDVAVNDLVMGDDGLPRKVLFLNRGVGTMYEIIPTHSGESFVVNEDHILTLVRTNISTHAKKARRDCIDGQVVDVSVKEYLTWSKSRKHLYKLYRTGVQTTRVTDWIIEPYFLGLLLGDGYLSSNAINITTMDKEVVAECYRQAGRFGLGISVQTKSQNKASTYSFIVPTHGARKKDSVFHNEIALLGLLDSTSGTKFIPPAYLRASTEDRYALLAGLLDSDGYLSRSTVYDYVSKSKQLSTDVVFLARSLGFSATLTQCEKRCQNNGGGTYYRVCISGNIINIPFRVARRMPPLGRQQIKNHLRSGFKVKELNIEPYYGFTLDGNGRYLLGDFTVTHNSGKSMVALAAGHGNRQTVVLTKTRALQHQYEVSYPSCQVLYGRNNYPCIHPDTPPNADMTAQDCRYEKPRDCEYFGACPYHVTKAQAMDASRAVLNYAYWMITHKKWQPELLVLDEAHNVSDVILEHVGTSINEHQRTTWGLPPFPLIESTTTSGLLRAQDYIAPDEAAAMWLNDAAGIMNQKVNTLRRVIEHGAHVTTKLLYQKRAAENLAHKLDTCLGAVEANPGDHWYIRSGPGVEYYQGQLVPGFLCKPLTARFDFPEFFATSPLRQVLIMSATIGQPETFAAELGLTDYTFYRTPAVWPPETRPVHILDVPSMGYAATKKDPTIFDQQADAIARAIKQLPDTWSGIILVSRKSEATLLANRLRARGLANRMWVPPGAENGEYKPTNEQIIAWEEQLRYRPNTIAVAWSFWEGVDAKDSQILIAAKVPFHPRSSEFEMAREQYDHSFASQRVAWLLEQGLGRVRRGDPSDYNDPKQGIVRTYVAIADGSWTRIRKYLSQSMLDSIVIN